LSDLHREIVEQSNAFRSLNTDLALTLKQGVGEALGPTLQRIATAVDDVSRFRPALSPRDLEQSFESSLVKVGDRFMNSFAGNTQGQSSR
jgi:hypothetical protein